MTDFTLATLPTTVAEGAPYTFSITAIAALTATVVVRWEIIPKGKLPVSSDDFASFTGSKSFVIGTTGVQTISIPTTNDGALEADQNFQIRIYQVVGDDDSTTTQTDDILLDTEEVRLTDADAGSSVAVTPASNAEGNVNTAAATQKFELNAKGGNDTYIITRYQSGDVRIAESAGTDLIKFDYGVFIARFAEVSTSNFVRLKIESAILTLSTGAKIEIEYPDRSTSFQLGDGEIITSYAAFKTAIGASGTNATATLESHDVTTLTTKPDISANTIAVAAEVLESTGLSDVIGLGGVADVSANGAGGDDTFVITRFQSGNVEIDDTVGTNLIKFDYGVSITAFAEASRVSFGKDTVSLATLTLSTGAKIAISFPAGAFNFQIGDAAVIDTYAAFKTAIGASLSNTASALAGTFTVVLPLTNAATGAVTVTNDAPITTTLGGGIVITSKAGVSILDGVKISTINSTVSSLSVNYRSLTNTWEILFNSESESENMLGEILAALRAKTTFTDIFDVTTDASYDENADSALLATSNAQNSVNHPFTSSPTTGTIFTADTSGIVDANGLTRATFTYQWLSGGAEISASATSATYTATAADAGKALTVRVRFNDDDGNAESLTSVMTDTPTTTIVPVPLVTVGLDANAPLALNIHGLVLTAKGGSGVTQIGFNAGLNGFGGNINGNLVNVNFSGGTYSTLGAVLPQLQRNGVINSRISFSTDDSYDANTSSTVLDLLNNSGSRSVHNLTPTHTTGTVLTSDAAAITDLTGVASTAFTYVWLRDGVEIPNAESATYTAVTADINKAITVRVSYTDANGNAQTITSSTANAPTKGVTIIHAEATLPTDAANVGETLTAVTTGLTDFDDATLTFTYQWKLAGADISGATAKTYTPTAVGAYSVVVIATDSVHSVTKTFTSEATDVVVLNIAPTGAVTTAAATELPSVNVHGLVFTLKEGGDANAQTKIDFYNSTGTPFNPTFPTGTDNILTIHWDPTTNAHNTFGELLTVLQGNAVVNANFVVTTGAGYNGGAATLVLDTTASSGSTSYNLAAPAATPLLSVNVHGLVFTAIAGGVANAATQLRFFNTSTSEKVEFIDGANRLDIDYNTKANQQVTFGELLIWLKAQTLITANFVVTTGAGYDATAATSLIDAQDRTGTDYALISTSTYAAGTIFTANTSTIADVDGLSTFSYQWLRGGAEISGAESATYTSVTADAGKIITVRIDYTDARGTAESFTSIAPDIATTGALAVTHTGVLTSNNVVRVGETLTADTSGLSDANDADLTFTYQWKLGGTDISGATGTGATYRPTAAGSYSVVVTATDDVNNVNKIYTSAATAFEVINALPTGGVSVTGSEQFAVNVYGITLTSKEGTAVNADTKISFFNSVPTQGNSPTDGTGYFPESNQILVNFNSAVAGNNNILSLQALITTTQSITDNFTITTPLSFPADSGAEGQKSSAGLDAVDDARTDYNFVPVSAVVVLGRTLTADTSALTDLDGLTGATFTYQWLRGGVDIENATNATYLVTSDDVGTLVTVRVSYTDDGGAAETLVSDTRTTGAVTISYADNSKPQNVPNVGEVLTAVTTDLTDADDAELTLTYQWQFQPEGSAVQTDVAGATSKTYIAAAVGRYTVVVTAIDDVKNISTDIISAGRVVEAANNAARGAVTIDIDTRALGDVLTADISTIADDDGLGSFFYQWLRGGERIDSAEARSSSGTYTLVADDIGKVITVRVGFADDGGSDEFVTSTNADTATTGTVTLGYPRGTSQAFVGAPLTAVTSGLSDADDHELTFTYQWQLNGANIIGATAKTYSPPTVGAYSVAVTAIDDVNNVDRVFNSAPVTPTVNFAPTLVNPIPDQIVTVGVNTYIDVTRAPNAVFSDAEQTPRQLSYSVTLTDGSPAPSWVSYFRIANGLQVEGNGVAIGTVVTLRVTATDIGGRSAFDDVTITFAGANNEPTGALTINASASIISVNIHGIKFTDKAGGDANAETVIRFFNTTRTNFESRTAANTLTISWDATAVTHNTLGEILALLKGDTLVSNLFDVTEGAGYDGDADSLVLDPIPNTGSVSHNLLESFATGTVLTANTSTIDDADGLGVFNYQWIRGGTEISGATNATYVVRANDVNSAITLRVDYTDTVGRAETLTTTVADRLPTGTASIAHTESLAPTDTMNVGETLTAVTSSFTDFNDATLTFGYEWRLVGSETILGRNKTYIPTAAGSYTVTVGASDSVYNVYTRGFVSAAITVTEATNVAPKLAIGGTAIGTSHIVSAAEGATAVVTFGAIDPNLDTITYQPLTGVDSGKFTLDTATGVITFNTAPDFETPTDANDDNDFQITVSVSDGTLSDTADITVRVTSVDEGDAAFTVTGGTATGDILTAALMTADPDAVTSAGYSYQWQAQAGGSGAWVDISGATSLTYALTINEIGDAVRIKVNYTDSSSTAESVTSTPTAIVIKAVSTPTPFVNVHGILFTLKEGGLANIDTSIKFTNTNSGLGFYTSSNRLIVEQNSNDTLQVLFDRLLTDSAATANFVITKAADFVGTTPGSSVLGGQASFTAKLITGSVTEDVVGTATGRFVATPNEVGDTITGYAVQIQATYGTVTVSASGAWTYVLDNTNTAVDALNTGQTLRDTITLRATESDNDVTDYKIAINIDGFTPAPPRANLVNVFTYLAYSGDATANSLTAGSNVDSVMQGLAGDDTLAPGTGTNVLIGGTGKDTINLKGGAGTDIILHRFASSGTTWTNSDGADTIGNFQRGTDKFVLTDTDGTALTTVAAFLAALGTSSIQAQVTSLVASSDGYGDKIATLEIRFGTSGDYLKINFDGFGGGANLIKASNASVSSGLATTDNALIHKVTDFAILDDLFGTDGFDVYATADLGVTIL